jgi:hypothetical protein
MATMTPLPQLQPMADPLESYSRIVALRSALQQQQLQQQQLTSEQQLQPLRMQQQQNVLSEQQQKLQDVRAGQQAYAEWDPADGYDKLAALTIQHGGSVSSAQAISNFGLNMLKTHSEILKNEGDVGKTKVDTLQKNNDIAAGKFDALNGVSDDQLPQAFSDTLTQGLNEGWVDKQHAQLGQSIAALPADQIRSHLPLIVKSYQSESAQQEALLKAAQTRDAAANAAYKEAENKMIQQYGGASDAALDVKYNALATNQAAGRPLSPDDLAFMRGYEKRKLLTSQFKVENRPSDIGTWQLVEDPKTGAPVLFNSKTGATQPAPGIAKPGTYEKTIGAGQAALNYANAYMSSGQFSGAGDEALLEKYFELAKPSSGFRMTQNQMDMLTKSRSWMQSAEGQAYHAANGTWFPPQQRQEIVSTMGLLQATKMGGGTAAPAPGYTRIQDSKGNQHDIPTANLPAARRIDPGLQVVR